MAGTKRYPLSNGGSVLVDAEDFNLVESFGKWHLSTNGYAVKRTRVKGKNKTFRLHRLVNKTPDGLVTDHINGDKLDNRKSNLRTVTQAVNSHDGTGLTHLKYTDLPKGVTFDVARNKYLATKTIRKRFSSLEDAIKFTKGGL